MILTIAKHAHKQCGSWHKHESLECSVILNFMVTCALGDNLKIEAEFFFLLVKFNF